MLNNTSREIRLASGVENLGNGPLKIQVKQGSAWVTCDNDDVIINAGEQIELNSTHYPVVVSPAHVDNAPIIFTVTQLNVGQAKPQPRKRSMSVLRAMMNTVVK